MSSTIYDLNMTNENTNYWRNYVPKKKKKNKKKVSFNLKELHNNRVERNREKHFPKPPPLPKNLPEIEPEPKPEPEPEYEEEEKEEQEEKYPESEDEEEELIKSIDCLNVTYKETEKVNDPLENSWNEEELKEALKLSIVTNNIDITRRKNNYQTLGRADFEKDELEKWKYECVKLTKQKTPCKRLIEKRKDLLKTFKHIINHNNKYERKIFYKKFNYVNSIIIKKYGYIKNK